MQDSKDSLWPVMLKSSQGKNTREGFQFLGAAFGDCWPRGIPGAELRICAQCSRGRMKMLALPLSPSWLWDQPVLGAVCPPTSGPGPLCSVQSPSLPCSTQPSLSKPRWLQPEQLPLCAQRCRRAQLLRFPGQQEPGHPHTGNASLSDRCRPHRQKLKETHV